MLQLRRVAHNVYALELQSENTCTKYVKKDKLFVENTFDYEDYCTISLVGNFLMLHEMLTMYTEVVGELLNTRKQIMVEELIIKTAMTSNLHVTIQSWESQHQSYYLVPKSASLPLSSESSAENCIRTVES